VAKRSRVPWVVDAHKDIRAAVLAASTPLLRSGRTSGLIIVHSDRPSSIGRPEPDSAKKKLATAAAASARRRRLARVGLFAALAVAARPSRARESD
jgi:hypothetical protein